jgi:hypothetical protein
MQSISFWAKQNPRKAQISIILLYVLINILAISSGLLFREVGIQFTTLVIYVSLGLFLIASIIYKRKANYYYRKTLDFVLISCTFLMIAFWGNHLNEREVYLPLSAKTANGITVKPSNSTNTASKIISGENHLGKKELRKLAKEKTQKNKLKIAAWAKVLLITLVVVAAIFSLYLVAILSCNISCSGAEGLAIVVLILGLIAILGGGYILIRRILGYQRKKRLKEEPDPSSDDY